MMRVCIIYSPLMRFDIVLYQDTVDFITLLWQMPMCTPTKTAARETDSLHVFFSDQGRAPGVSWVRRRTRASQWDENTCSSRSTDNRARQRTRDTVRFRGRKHFHDNMKSTTGIRIQNKIEFQEFGVHYNNKKWIVSTLNRGNTWFLWRCSRNDNLSSHYNSIVKCGIIKSFFW